MSKTKTTSQFIIDAIKIHHDLYTYSNVHYTNTHTKIIIDCKRHGPFSQRPNRHLQGDGCPSCGDERTTNSKIKSICEIIEQSQKVHGDKFEYTSLINNGYDGKGIIIIDCMVHGPFSQRLTDHLHSAAGCPLCANKIKGNWCLRTKEQFLEEALSVFGTKYDYANIIYKNMNTKLNVNCLIHGEFWVTPSNHIFNKSGCPLCYESKGEQMVRGVLQQLGLETEPQKTFEYLTSGNTDTKRSLLRFDFFITNNQIAIEYDGYFHYNLPPIRLCSSYQKAWERYVDLKRCDALKDEFCVNNQICLIRNTLFYKIS